MAGATLRHNRLCERVRDAIRPCLGDGPCILDGSDQRLAVESVEEYLIVSHERREVELGTRTERRWQRHLATEGTLRLRCGAAIDVAPSAFNGPFFQVDAVTVK